MVNGNDLLEYEESHIEELYEGFVMDYAEAYEAFKVNRKFEENLEEKFTAFMGDRWTTYVLDDYNNTQAGHADMLVDMAKEGD